MTFSDVNRYDSGGGVRTLCEWYAVLGSINRTLMRAMVTRPDGGPLPKLRKRQNLHASWILMSYIVWFVRVLAREPKISGD